MRLCTPASDSSDYRRRNTRVAGFEVLEQRELLAMYVSGIPSVSGFAYANDFNVPGVQEINKQEIDTELDGNLSVSVNAENGSKRAWGNATFNWNLQPVRHEVGRNVYTISGSVVATADASPLSGTGQTSGPAFSGFIGWAFNDIRETVLSIECTISASFTTATSPRSDSDARIEARSSATSSGLAYVHQTNPTDQVAGFLAIYRSGDVRFRLDGPGGLTGTWNITVTTTAFVPMQFGDANKAFAPKSNYLSLWGTGTVSDRGYLKFFDGDHFFLYQDSFVVRHTAYRK